MAKITLKTAYSLFFLACLLSLAGLTTSALAQTEVAIVNAASFAKDGGAGTTTGSGIVSPDALASAFGTFNVTAGQTSYSAPSGQPLPTTLGGVKLRVGTTDAQLLFVGTQQINFIIPSGTATGGIVDIVVTNANATTVPGKVRVEAFAPGFFSAAASGKGVAAANWTITGQQPYPLVFTTPAGGQPTHVTLDAGTKAKPTYLILYATGVRNAPDTIANDPAPGFKNVAESCTVTIQGVPAKVDYAGRQADFFGLDQINAIIPPELSGLGILNIRIEIKSGQTSRVSNDVEIAVGGSQTPYLVIKDLNLNGDTVTGALTADDQVEIDNSPTSPFYKKTYFIDTYRFRTTAANTTIAVDLRSNLADPDPLDTQIIIRKVESSGAQSFFAADDQGGGFGNCPNPPGTCKPIEVNNNSLLLTVVPEASEYLLFVTSADVAPNDMGAYTLKFSTGALTPIAYGQTLNGSFSTNTKAQTATGVYVDGYYFTGREGETVRITMRAPSPVDSFLILRERNGDEIRLDDNSAGGNDAQLSLTLPQNNALPITRQFVIVATPLANLVTGSYTLQLEKTAGLQAPEAVSTEFRIPNRVSNEPAPRRSVASRAMWRRPAPQEPEQ